jgi:hypothetical protein
MGCVLSRTLARALGVCATAALACTAPAARATDWQFSLDTRLVDSDGQKSFLQGGLGTLRFGSDQSGLQLGRLRLALDQPLGQILTVHLDASSWGDHEKNPIDLTEAFMELRPYPRAGWRARLKAGAFYAPISLENRLAGWESPYTLSYSALDSWIAEELRTIGMEGSLEWLGTRLGHDFDVALTGAVFGWNDPAGVAIANHGFALQDRQTGLFERIGQPGAVPVRGFEVFHEIDGQPGFYEGLEVRYLDRIVLRALHYDNQADPGALDVPAHRFAWHTRFDTAGVRFDGDQGWSAIVQWLDGQTYLEPVENRYLEWAFNTRYALLSKRIGRHALSVRYDDFGVVPHQTQPNGDQQGHAFTAAYIFEPSAHWRFTLEWLRVRSSNANRQIYLGEAPLATESALTLAVRYALGAHR